MFSTLPKYLDSGPGETGRLLLSTESKKFRNGCFCVLSQVRSVYANCPNYKQIKYYEYSQFVNWGRNKYVSSKFIEYKFQVQHMKHFCGHCFEFASVFVSIKKL